MPVFGPSDVNYNLGGQNPAGQLVPLPVTGSSYISTSNLAANQTITTGWIDTKAFGTVFVKLFSDQPSATGGYVLDISNDASTILDTASASYTLVNDFRRSAFTPSVRYFRYTYTNGSNATTKFTLAVDQYATPISPTLQGLSNTASSTNLATVSKAILEVPDASGAYSQPQRTGASLNVNVTGGVTATDTSALSTSANQTNGNQKTQVTNFPATQPISGTVTATPPAGPSAATTTSVASSTSAVTVLASNTARKGATIFQDGSGTGYLKLGSGASATSYTTQLTNNEYYEVPYGYTGVITCLSTTTAATFRVSELV